MDPITLAVVAGLGLIAVKVASGNNSPNSRKQLPAKTSPPTATPNPNTDAIAKFVAAAAAATGGALVGATAGDWIDTQIQGGSDNVVTKTVARVGGGALGAGAALAVFFPALWPVVGVALLVVACVYAIASIISDIGRVAYGQAGATADYAKAWDTLYSQMFSTARANPDFAKYSDSEISRFITPVVDGYQRNLNRVAYRQWMLRGRGFLGLGGTDGEHAKWGFDRGYFVAAYMPGSGALKEAWPDSPNHLMRSENPAWIEQNVPMTERAYVTRQVIMTEAISERLDRASGAFP
jgi:hypothetical protein